MSGKLRQFWYDMVRASRGYRFNELVAENQRLTDGGNQALALLGMETAKRLTVEGKLNDLRAEVKVVASMMEYDATGSWSLIGKLLYSYIDRLNAALEMTQPD